MTAPSRREPLTKSVRHPKPVRRRKSDDIGIPVGDGPRTSHSKRHPHPPRQRKSGRYNSLPQWGKVSPQGTDEVSFTQCNSSSTMRHSTSWNVAWSPFSHRRRHINPHDFPNGVLAKNRQYRSLPQSSADSLCELPMTAPSRREPLTKSERHPQPARYRKSGDTASPTGA